MYPPSPPRGGFEVMLGESLGRRIESSLEELENNKPQPAVTSARSNLNASRRALLKKGARRVRAASSLQNKHGQGQLLHHHQGQLLHHHQGQLLHHHQAHLHHHQGLLRSSSSSQGRLTDINNNNSSASRPGAPAAELPPGRTATPAGTHLKPAKKELLKLKTGRTERGSQTNGQPIHSLSKHEQSALNLNVRSQKSRLSAAPAGVTLVRKCETSDQQSAPVIFLAARREGKRPLSSADGNRNTNLSPTQLSPEENLKDGEKTYAGAKFSEPPSPSVLPKPPSHWMGDNSPKHSTSSREQMSVHLKTLLKVQA